MNKNFVVKDQKYFFDNNAKKVTIYYNDPLFLRNYINRQQIDGLEWISKASKLLEYGAGTGDTISLLENNFPNKNRKIHAVDISLEALKHAKKRFPTITIEVVSNNKIKCPSNYFDAVAMVHVLHHTHNHQDIIKELYRILKPGGKLMINDLTSKNPLVTALRLLFPFIPNKIKNHFSDDLTVSEGIPDKYPLNLKELYKLLESNGFTLSKVGRGHLFFFIFCWIERIFPLSQYKVVKDIYVQLIKLESWLIHNTIFRQFSEVIYIYAVK